MSLSPVTVELKAGISEFKAKLREAGEEVEHLSKKGGATFGKFSAVGKAALMGIGGIAVGLGTVSLEMADKFEVSHAKLEAAIAATGGNFEEIKGRVDEATSKMAKFGFTSADTEAALAQFATSTGSSTAGFKQLGLAADLAKFKNISLADASLAVAKAMEGNLRPLKQLGIDVPIAAGGAKALAQAHTVLAGATQKLATFLKIHRDAVNANSKQHGVYLQMVDKVRAAQQKLTAAQGASTKILDVLHQKLGGQASKAAETFAGKTAAAKAQIENLSARLGLALIPFIEKAISVTQRIVDWFTRHKTTTEALAGVIGGVLVVSIGAYIASLVKAAAESVVSFAKMAASAAVWVAEQLAGLASVVAGYAVAFASMIGAAMAWAAGMLVAGATALLPFLPIIAACAAVAAAGYLLYKHWDQIWSGIKTVAVAAWHWIDSNVVHPIESGFSWVVRQIKAHWDLILGILTGPIGLAVGVIAKNWDTIVGTVRSLPGRIAAAASGMWDGIKNAFRSAINWIISGWNSLHFGIPSIDTHIPGIGKIGGGSFGVPQIPMLAKGGIVSRPTLAVIGEAGPEAVVPLGKGHAGMGGDIYITVNAPGHGNPQEIARQTVNALRRYKKELGGGALGLA